MYSDIVIQTYEKILNGEQKSFSPYFFQPEHRKERVITLVKYMVEEKLKVTPEDAIKILNYPILKKYELLCILPYIPKPKESTEDDVDHVIFYAYPEIPQPTLEQRTVIVYVEVLEGKRKKYPKNYFIDGPVGEQRAIICFKYLCESILGYLDTDGNLDKEKMTEAFLLNRDYMQIFKQYKLKVLFDMVYNSRIDLLDKAYPGQLDYTKKGTTQITIIDKKEKDDE